MSKCVSKIKAGLFVPVLFLSAVLISGCVPERSERVTEMADLKGGVIRSTDRGTTYTPRTDTEGGKSILGVQTLWLAMDQQESEKVYLGSHENGIFMTENGGETWQHMQTPFIKVYGIEIDPRYPNTLYAIGVEDGRGKIFKSSDGGATWKGIYNEPSNETVIIALDMSRHDPNVLYAGTSGGTIVKTVDGGVTWENMHFANAPVRDIAVDPFDSSTVYALIFEDTLLLSRDYGKTFSDMRAAAQDLFSERQRECREKNSESVTCNESQPTIGNVYSFTLDLNSPGLGYVGTDDGLKKFLSYGAEWEEVNTIASSRAFPLRTVTVNPYRSQEIFYSSARALYRSLDGGTNWYTYELEAKATPSIILHDWNNPDNLYVGLREAKEK